jgi:crossover junction endodeoxyribonuclease RuvC
MVAKPKIILGLDPGLADTGFGVISKEAYVCRCVEAGTIRTSKTLALPQRLRKIYTNVEELILKYQPELVAVEKLYFARNVKTALDVAQARGVILLALGKHHQKLIEFTPLQIKQAIASNGQASKQQVGLMVKTLLHLKTIPRPDDAADALAIAMTAASFNRFC